MTVLILIHAVDSLKMTLENECPKDFLCCFSRNRSESRGTIRGIKFSGLLCGMEDRVQMVALSSDLKRFQSESG